MRGIVAGLALVCVVVAGCGGGSGGAGSAGTAAVDAQAEFYGMLENAARQQRLRVAMYRETFANEADAKAGSDPGTVSSSVSEIDTERGRFRAVFATNQLNADGGFTLGRCHDRMTYIDHYSGGRKRPSTLEQATGRLAPAPKGDLYPVTQPLVFISCPHLGLMPGGTQIAMSRLCDGVFPVTLSPPQAANWVAALRAAKLFQVRDEGTETVQGMTVRKLSFAPAPGDYTVNTKLNSLFTTAGEIERIKRETPKAEVAYEFLAINPGNTGGVGGYYLVDETRKLPVASELYGTNRDRPRTTRAAGQNIARTQQHYAFPPDLTMNLDTPLELLGR